MKTSFNKTPATTEVAPEPAQEQAAIVPATSRVVAVQSGANDFQGEWLSKDRRLPRINLVQKVSESNLVRNYGIGAFVLAKEVKIGDEENPLIVTALQAFKDYVQKVEFDSGDTPAIFRTEEEVIQAGGSLNYKDIDGGNFFQRRAHVEFAFAAPEGLSEASLALFPYEFRGTPYALAIYTVASSAYTSLAMELATMRNANKVLRQGLRYGNLQLSSVTRKKNARTWNVPTIKYNGANSPELIKFFEEIDPSLVA